MQHLLKRTPVLLKINNPKIKWEVTVILSVQLSLLHMQVLCVSFPYQHQHMGSDTDEEFWTFLQTDEWIQAEAAAQILP